MLSKGASWLGRLTAVGLLLVDELSCWSVRVSHRSEKEIEERRRERSRSRPAGSAHTNPTSSRDAVSRKVRYRVVSHAKM